MSHLRRLSLVSVPALALSTLAFVPATPASAAEPDPTPVSHGADWLAGQLTDGLMHNDQFDFDDLGLTTDTGLAMAYLDESDTAGDISDALAPRITEYYTYDVANSEGQLVGTHVSAGSLAKAAAFVDAAGDDPTDFGGHDLVAELDAVVAHLYGLDAGDLEVIWDTFHTTVDHLPSLDKVLAHHEDWAR